MGVVSTACPTEVSLREEGPFSALMLSFFPTHFLCTQVVCMSFSEKEAYFLRHQRGHPKNLFITSQLYYMNYKFTL